MLASLDTVFMSKLLTGMNTSNKNKVLNIDVKFHVFNRHVHIHIGMLQHFRIKYQ